MGVIPVVGLPDYGSASAATVSCFVEAVCGGLCEFGFILVEGHAVDPALVQRVYGHFESFFGQDAGQSRQLDPDILLNPSSPPPPSLHLLESLYKLTSVASI